jgi:hypothetical protein
MVNRMPGRSVDAIRNKLDIHRRRAQQLEKPQVAAVGPLVVEPTVELMEIVQQQENHGIRAMSDAKAFLGQSSRKAMDAGRNEKSVASAEAIGPIMLE